MGLIGAMVGGSRIAAQDAFSDYWYQPLGAPNASGLPITPETALKISIVFGCVRLISESLGALPLIVYQRQADGGKTRATQHPLYDVLHDAPNADQTTIEFLSMMQAHLLLRGNAYAEILSGPRGPVDQLVPLHPDRIRIDEQPDGSLRYRVRQPRGGTERTILPDEMFHLRGLSLDGKTGLSVVSYAAQSMGLAAAAESYGASFFGRGSRPAGILKTTGKLTEAGADRLQKRWQAAYGGVQNSGKVAVMEEGLEFQALGMTNEDSQFLQTREFQAADVARWFGVPLHMVQLESKDTSWGSGIESMSLGFVTFTLQAWLQRWEQKIASRLLLAPKSYTVEFLLDGLLRGNTTERFAAYQVAAGGNAPWMSRNEIRRRENMNPLPGLDAMLQPLNMGGGGGSNPTGGTTGTGLGGQASFARDAAERVARREVAALGRAARRCGDDGEMWLAEVERFYAAHAEFVAETMRLALDDAQQYAWEQETFLRANGPDTLGDKFIRVSASRLQALALAEPTTNGRHE